MLHQQQIDLNLELAIQADDMIFRLGVEATARAESRAGKINGVGGGCRIHRMSCVRVFLLEEIFTGCGGGCVRVAAVAGS